MATECETICWPKNQSQRMSTGVGLISRLPLPAAILVGMKTGMTTRFAAFVLLAACTESKGELVEQLRSGKVNSPCEDSSQWQSLILTHAKRYPNMQVVDALKLLHHATMGSEHAITDTAVTLQWMEREWTSMDEGPDEPLVDTLGIDGRYARLHLRPFKQRGGDKGEVVQAFIRTSTVRGDTASLVCALQTLETLAGLQQVTWNADSVRAASAEWRSRGYRPVSHSQAFREAHRPAYRVIAVELLDSLMGR
jgi:hypothetical protein